MVYVSIIAVNDNCEEKEKTLKEFFNEKFKNLAKYEMIELKSNKFDDIIEECKEVGQVILVFDAVEGKNPSFSYIAKKFFKNEIRPILLIADCDNENANIKEADNALAEIWKNECPWLDESLLYFDNLYFSYNNRAVDIIPKTDLKNDISELIKKLDNKINDWE